jgi:ubiquinone/menaquinone biosynthesis C-methylase UbiE
MKSSVNIFNDSAEAYDRWYDTHHWIYQSEILAIERLLPRRVNAIEIGVGTGRFASAFGIRMGIDPSLNMLKLAHKRKIQCIQGVAESLPFFKESFNLVLLVTTICFISNIKKGINEIYRILNPGGQLVIGFIDKLSPLGKKYQLDKECSRYFKEAMFYSPEELAELLLQKSFDDLLFVQTLFKPLDQIKQIEASKNGYGKGSFVVVRAIKY